jgi:hypothetical protein
MKIFFSLTRFRVLARGHPEIDIGTFQIGPPPPMDRA